MRFCRKHSALQVSLVSTMSQTTSKSLSDIAMLLKVKHKPKSFNLKTKLIWYLFGVGAVPWNESTRCARRQPTGCYWPCVQVFCQPCPQSWARFVRGRRWIRSPAVRVSKQLHKKNDLSASTVECGLVEVTLQVSQKRDSGVDGIHLRLEIKSASWISPTHELMSSHWGSAFDKC